ncbi:MAG: helix-turn-helix transcriptional regulator [Enterococcus viikkiensis]|uniref:Helix-turn-helix transcriptional regulator n=1 Tax=Enterococcus viikkiensis TaxID=930854 RepID=A0ABU3FQE9_9ENTE|nr:helix-turn-helix transcriptional regulator [Enterococcus viikkiensis]MDT2827907.1 helix-turn-helix transcriptional regulator [Enterococcus viikkiensis]
MYDLLILGSLLTGDKTGYKLQKIMSLALSPMRKISNGILYPVLDKLEEQGLVTSHLHEVGRKSKLLHLTEKGREHFFTLMREPVPQDAKREDVLHFKLRSIDSVPVVDQITILMQYREFMQKDLAIYQAAQKEMSEHAERLPDYAQRFQTLVAVYDLDIKVAETKIAWVDQRLKAIERK